MKPHGYKTSCFYLRAANGLHKLLPLFGTIIHFSAWSALLQKLQTLRKVRCKDI